MLENMITLTGGYKAKPQWAIIMFPTLAKHFFKSHPALVKMQNTGFFTQNFSHSAGSSINASSILWKQFNIIKMHWDICIPDESTFLLTCVYQEIDTEIFILILLKIGKIKKKYRKKNDSKKGTEEKIKEKTENNLKFH